MSDIVKTPQDAFDLLRDMRQYFDPFHADLNNKIDLREGRIMFKVPDGFDKHVPSTAFDKIQDGVNHVMSLKLKAEVPEKAATKKGEKQAGTLTSWLNDKFFKFLPQSDYVDPSRQFTTNMFTYGLAVIKGPFWDYEKWGEEPERDKGESTEDYDARYGRWKLRRDNCFPFIVRVPDPRIVYFDPTYPPQFVFESYTRKAITIKKMWPEWDMTLDGSKGYRPMDDVTWCEYWDADKRLFWIQDSPVAAGDHILGSIVPEKGTKGTVKDFRENAYGYVPYIVKFSGIGSVTPDANLKDRAVGLLDHAASDIRAEARLITSVDAATYLSAWNNLVVDGDKVPAGGLDLDFSPGAVNELPGEVIASLKNMNVPTVTADTYRHLAMTSNRIQKSTFPDSMGGLRQADSGYQEEALIGQGKGKLIPFMQPIEQAFSELASRALQIVDTVIEGSVWEVAAKDIMGYYTANVTFDARTPEETDRRKALAMNLAPTGLLSKRTLRAEYLDVSDPDEEETRILVEHAQQNPAVMQALVAGAIRDWGAEKFIQQLQEKQDLLNVKPSGGGGAPLEEIAAQGAPQPEAGAGPDIRTMRRAVPTATPLGGNGEQAVVQ